MDSNMKKDRYKIMNTYVNVVSMEETIQRVEKIIKMRKPTQHVVINASKVNLMEKDPELSSFGCPISTHSRSPA